MYSKVAVVLLVGLVASSFALDLSHADPHALEAEPRLISFLSDFYDKVVHPPMNHVVTSLALLGAQFLAGLSEVGLPTIGRRSLQASDAQLRGIVDDLWNKAIKPHLQNVLSGFSLLAAQLLANFGSNGAGFGKRDLSEAEMRGFTDALADAFNSVFSNVIQKPLEDALAGGALMLAQVLAGLGTNGVSLGSILGKRDLGELAGRQEELRGFFSTLGQGLLTGLQATWTNVIQSPLEEALTTTSLLAAQVLAGLGTTGVNLGKRSVDARGPIIDDLINHASGLLSTQVKPAVENVINSAILQLASALANFSQNGIGRR